MLYGRSVDFQRVLPVGWHAHEEAVAALLESFRQVPDGQRVRLAKKTSNLFRSRGTGSVGLDVDGLRGVIAIDPVAKTADVQGMCTCLLYTSPSPRDRQKSRMPSSA